MDTALWAALGGGAALVLLATGAALATVVGRSRAGAGESAALAAAQADVEELRARLEALTDRLERAEAGRGAQPEFVITTAGAAAPEVAEEAAPAVPDRAVLSVTLGEPLVKLVAFGYGVRKALSPESRNRIRFEMRREVRRTRKSRRQASRRTARTAARATAREAADLGGSAA